MYYQIESVLEKYDLKDAVISKGRQVLVCEKNEKWYGLKEFFGTEKKAEFLYQLGEFLTDKDFLVDALVKTSEETYFAEGVDGVCYTLHRWHRGRECDIKNRMEVLLAVSHLAKFHLISREFPVSGQMPRFEEPVEEYQRHNKELRKIYQFVRKRKKKSEYEQLFLSCFSEFFSQCEEICQQMIGKNLLTSNSDQGICHGDFNYHNILSVMGRPVLLQFERAGYGLQIFDFCNFKRKIMEKYCWDEGLGIAMLAEYHRVCPLNEKSFWQMYYRLAYPEKFWKLADRYYVSSKSWISPQNYEKLEKELRQNPFRKRYLEKLLHLYENWHRKY